VGARGPSALDPGMLSPELVSFLESGVSILVATRDARLVPESTRAIGARVEAGGVELVVFLPDAISATTLANLRENGRVAVAFSRPHDNRSFQVKGRALAVEPAAAEGRAVIERYRCAWSGALAAVGVPPRLSLRAAHWPAHGVRIGVEAVFVQTPGPGAGARLEHGEAVP
jgi:hypothetical protein